MFCAGLEYQKQGNKKQADMHNFGINIKAAAVPKQNLRDWNPPPPISPDQNGRSVAFTGYIALRAKPQGPRRSAV
jgi:hypothetical protein